MISLASIYLPCDKINIDSLVLYQLVLGELQSTIDHEEHSNFLATGDFNADPK